jgi:hypothetical protein
MFQFPPARENRFFNFADNDCRTEKQGKTNKTSAFPEQNDFIILYYSSLLSIEITAILEK